MAEILEKTTFAELVDKCATPRPAPRGTSHEEDESPSVVLLLAAGVVVLHAQTAGGLLAGPPRRPARQARGSLSLSGAWALYPLAVRWQEEFQKSHPGTVVDVQAGGAGKGIADALAGVADIGMVSREINPAEMDKGAVALAVAKDAVVATVSAKNPLLADLLRRGLKQEDLAALWIERGLTKTWEALLGRDGRTPVHVFTRSDACGAAETWAAYLGETAGGPGRRRRLRRSRAGRGRPPRPAGHRLQQRQLRLRRQDPEARGRPRRSCPIDLDGNGRIDPAESVLCHARRHRPRPLPRTLSLAAGPRPLLRHQGPARAVRVVAAFLTLGADRRASNTSPRSGYIRRQAEDRVAAGLASLRDDSGDEANEAAQGHPGPAGDGPRHRAAGPARPAHRCRPLPASPKAILGVAPCRRLLFSLGLASARRASSGSLPFIIGTFWVTVRGHGHRRAALACSPPSISPSTPLAGSASGVKPVDRPPGRHPLGRVRRLGRAGDRALRQGQRSRPLFGTYSPPATACWPAASSWPSWSFRSIIHVSLEVFRAVPQDAARRVAGRSAPPAGRPSSTWCCARRCPGWLAAIVLGFSRAFGETMAVLMVVGNVPEDPRSRSSTRPTRCRPSSPTTTAR
ncbi:MAG: substrate-binding domain-containing protein [Candidatus Moduliflexus flocculans]|nr:substrate-binding domain-containing protein [Candidatus Moduliflexus flocculans]